MDLFQNCIGVESDPLVPVLFKWVNFNLSMDK